MDYCGFSSTLCKTRFALPPSAFWTPPIAYRLRPFVVAAVGVKCELGGWTAPLEPRSSAGRHLSGMLLDDRDAFRAAARAELERLAVQTDGAVARLQLSRGSDEAPLHRRIAELKKQECRAAVEDVIYAIILHEFYQMRVYLVPELSKCICNSRLEIFPSKDWELESIHSIEVLEMVRDHVSSITGCRANSCVKECWATTKIRCSCLCKMYTASVLFGYFLKSAALRRRLEWNLNVANSAHSSSSNLPVPLGSRSFMRMGFDEESVVICASPESKEAANVVERRSLSLFGGVGEEAVITTSFGSVKRLMLEGVAFGCFLWESEDWIKSAVEPLYLNMLLREEHL
ncbi:UV-B-induced protein At3g17800, chloroplastic-like [Andrographis paniculata]|uniref:UV-B-induced protein At3g17800, chloroplastic-like n=1 Tax=Andrographis paniculata TaxID=175694 RepID=UPI0021E75319|nr:UV-B-induced protein At3g17800, chloroplastic-like [Andrographis paniculata]